MQKTREAKDEEEEERGKPTGKTLSWGHFMQSFPLSPVRGSCVVRFVQFAAIPTETPSETDRLHGCPQPTIFEEFRCHRRAELNSPLEQTHVASAGRAVHQFLAPKFLYSPFLFELSS